MSLSLVQQLQPQECQRARMPLLRKQKEITGVLLGEKKVINLTIINPMKADGQETEL